MKLITSIICSHTLFWTASSLAFPAKEIVGGTDAAAGAYPFVVSLEDPPFQFCGGSILASGRILTAAHCVEGYVRTEGTTLKAYAGSNDRTTHEFSSDILFTSVHMHPDYDRITQDYDIAILELETPFVLSDTIQSIGLVGAGEQPESGTEATVIGWGLLSAGGDQPTLLQEVTLPVESSSECQRHDYANLGGLVTDRMFCAGPVPDEERDSCTGDSGGPIFQSIDGTRKQVGIVSWGSSCGGSTTPGVYVDLANAEIAAWVVQNAGGEN